MMKKIILLFALMLTIGGTSAHAQKFALIDMEYILNKIPAYGQANTQIEQASKQWQSQVEKIAQEAKEMYKSYQAQVSKLSDAQRSQKEEAIIAKEKEASDLRRQYFGPEGKLYEKRQELISPIEDRIYNAVKEIATRQGYSVVLDRASAQSIIFASPSIDISNEVLHSMGYSN